MYYILEKWLERHPEIKKQKKRIRISSGRFTLPNGYRTELIDASIAWGPDIDGYDPSKDVDLYEYFLAEDQGDNIGPAAEKHEPGGRPDVIAQNAAEENDQQKLKLGKGVTFVKSQLRRLAQGKDVWEADFRPACRSLRGNDTVWCGLVVEHGGGIVAYRTVAVSPTVNDMAILLADAMKRPLDEMPRRPHTLRIRARHEWQELLPHLRQLLQRVVSAPRLAKWDEAFKEFSRCLLQADPTPPEIELRYPGIAEWVRTRGWIEIGDQKGVGFVARALDQGGVVFDGRTVKTLAEAMSALEQGIAVQLGDEGLGSV
jgi:hypothetical protein